MFGHLDDPEPRAPGGREMADVLRRGRLIRLRRRIGVAALTCVAVAVVSVGFVVTRPSTVRISTSETGYQFNALKGPLSVGTPVPTTALINVVFEDARDGFAVAAHRGTAVLAVTSDGGSSWTVQDDALPPGYGQSAGYPGEFEFAGSDGYLWGGAPQAGGAVPLWVTSDDGLSWHEASIGPVVYDVSAIGKNVWALSGQCTAAAIAGSTPAPCALEVEESLDGGVTWNTAESTGFADVVGAPPLAQRVELARITESRSYVLTSNGSGQPGGIGLVYTDDSGQTWTARPVPCAGDFDQGAEIAASGTDDLWLLCGSDASAGDQSKDLYRSADGGMTWTLTASATGLGTPAAPAAPATPGAPAPLTADPNALPVAGYTAPFSVGHRNLAVASPTTAWIYPSRATLYETVDGGSAWAAVTGLDTAGFGTGGAGNVTFVSATQGWICAYGVGLWHTSDGVHWSPLGV
jgi:hypothetical protein